MKKDYKSNENLGLRNKKKFTTLLMTAVFACSCMPICAAESSYVKVEKVKPAIKKKKPVYIIKKEGSDNLQPVQVPVQVPVQPQTSYAATALKGIGITLFTGALGIGGMLAYKRYQNYVEEKKEIKAEADKNQSIADKETAECLSSYVTQNGADAKQKIEKSEAEIRSFMNLNQNDIESLLRVLDNFEGKVLIQRINDVLNRNEVRPGVLTRLIFDVVGYFKKHGESGFNTDEIVKLRNYHEEFKRLCVPEYIDHVTQKQSSSTGAGMRLGVAGDHPYHDRPQNLVEPDTEKEAKLKEGTQSTATINNLTDAQILLLKLAKVKIYVTKEQIDQNKNKKVLEKLIKEGLLYVEENLKEMQSKFDIPSNNKNLIFYNKVSAAHGETFAPVAFAVFSDDANSVIRYNPRSKELEKLIGYYYNIFGISIDKDNLFNQISYIINQFMFPGNCAFFGECNKRNETMLTTVPSSFIRPNSYPKSELFYFNSGTNNVVVTLKETLIDLIGYEGDVIETISLQRGKNIDKNYPIKVYENSKKFVTTNREMLDYLYDEGYVPIGKFSHMESAPMEKVQAVYSPIIDIYTTIIMEFTTMFKKGKIASSVGGLKSFAEMNGGTLFREVFNFFLGINGEREDRNILYDFDYIDENGTRRNMQLVVIVNGRVFILTPEIMLMSIQEVFEMMPEEFRAGLFQRGEDGRPVFRVNAIGYANRDLDTDRLRFMSLLDAAGTHVNRALIDGNEMIALKTTVADGEYVDQQIDNSLASFFYNSMSPNSNGKPILTRTLAGRKGDHSKFIDAFVSSNFKGDVHKISNHSVGSISDLSNGKINSMVDGEDLEFFRLDKDEKYPYSKDRCIDGDLIKIKKPTKAEDEEKQEEPRKEEKNDDSDNGNDVSVSNYAGGSTYLTTK